MKLQKIKMLEAIFFGHEEIKRLVAFNKKSLIIFNLKNKIYSVERDEALVEKVKALTEEKLKDTVLTFDKQQRDENLDALKRSSCTFLLMKKIQKMKR